MAAKTNETVRRLWQLLFTLMEIISLFF